MSQLRQSRCADHFRRVLATCCAALVFTLGLFAASPLLHEQLHHNDHSSAGDSCAVVLFANGVSVPLAVTAMPPPPAEWVEQSFARSAEIDLSSPRYRLLPPCGPPVG